VADPPRLYVSERLIRRLLALPARPWEVGGWLLGYWSDDRNAIVVTHATPPAFRGTAFGITISSKGHRRRFDEAWQRSDGHVTFIGDWHTHPASRTIPSATDVRAMRQLAEDRAYGTPEPLIAIASVPRWARTPHDAHAAFHLRCADGDVIALAPILFSELPIEAQVVPDWRWPSHAVDRAPRS
jgi:integrative and conjugative element protein (TIGR02256 family)